MQSQTFVGAEGQNICADVAGSPGSPVVLLAHGGGQTKAAWSKAMSALCAAGWRAVALDLRGHGSSDWSPSGSYRIEDFADDIRCVVRQLETRPAYVGASLGGLAGLIAEGEQEPGLFESLTLVDITPTMEPAGVARVVGFMREHLENGFASPEEAAAVIAAYMPNRERRGAGSGLARYLRLGEDGRYRWHWDPRFITSIMSARDEQRIERLAEAASNLSLPVHLIRGGASDLVSEEGAAEFRRLVPHSSFTDIVGAGHMVVGDRNDAFVAAILEFLATSPSRESAE